MKKILALVLAPVIFSPGAASPGRQGAQTPAAESRWETYTYPGEEFSVSMPEMPAMYEETRSIRGRPNETRTMRAYAAYGDGVVYLIWSYDKPQPAEGVDHFAQYFRTYKLPRDVKVYGREEAKLGDFGGRRYGIVDGRFPDGDNEFTFYVYRARRHAYLVAAYGAGERDGAVRRFFQSFNLSEGPAGTAVAEVTPPKFEVLKKEPAKAADGHQQSTDADPPAPADAPADYVPTKELTRKAVQVFRPEPLYTELARREHITGTVTLRLFLRSDGKVSNIVAVSRLRHGLTENAVRAAGKIKFIPAVKDGRRVSQYVNVRYNFNIY